mmetsp:Transcript_56874/g.132581  ORF Transcript_56874/g.132581 Transcript_56874/m.132581 type:complete len:331 (-) Transcript_56874:64-1056(-)
MWKDTRPRAMPWELSPGLQFWKCQCDCESEKHTPAETVLVQTLNSEYSEPGQRQDLTREDSFDITFTPRTMESEVVNTNPITPRQRHLQVQLELPMLPHFPTPPGSRSSDSPEELKQRTLEMYQGFALDLHQGMYLTQLMADRSYSDIHCQLMEDMSTLKLDQSNGRIVEFPLANVSKVYRLVKSRGKYVHRQQEQSDDADQIVVVVFTKRKLAFVFKELRTCQRFMFCLELLIWRAQQEQQVPLLRSSTQSRREHAGSSASSEPPLSPHVVSKAAPPRLTQDTKAAQALVEAAALAAARNEAAAKAEAVAKNIRSLTSEEGSEDSVVPI